MGEDFNISGIWVNRMNGDRIAVRNTFIDGDNMIIMTQDGRQLTMNEFQNYIQMTDENGNVDNSFTIGTNNIDNERRVVVGQTSGNNLKQFADAHLTDKVSSIRTEVKDQLIEKNNFIESSESNKLLDKLFNKLNLNIDIKIDLTCPNFPGNELNMLKDIYDVTDDDIAEYIRVKMIDDDLIRNSISRFVSKELN